MVVIDVLVVLWSLFWLFAGLILFEEGGGGGGGSGGGVGGGGGGSAHTCLCWRPAPEAGPRVDAEEDTRVARGYRAGDSKNFTSMQQFEDVAEVWTAGDALPSAKCFDMCSL